MNSVFHVLTTINLLLPTPELLIVTTTKFPSVRYLAEITRAFVALIKPLGFHHFTLNRNLICHQNKLPFPVSGIVQIKASSF